MRVFFQQLTLSRNAYGSEFGVDIVKIIFSDARIQFKLGNELAWLYFAQRFQNSQKLLISVKKSVLVVSHLSYVLGQFDVLFLVSGVFIFVLTDFIRWYNLQKDHLQTLDSLEYNIYILGVLSKSYQVNDFPVFSLTV